MSYTYTVSVPANKSRKFRAMVKDLGGEVSRGARKMSAYEKSLEDVRCGRVREFSSLEDLWAELNS